MTALAIDLWDKRCGIATQVESIAFPAEIVARHELIGVIKKYIKTWKYQSIVVGMPHDLYGKQDRQLNKTQDFVDKLYTIFPEIDIHTIDERFTSFAADQTLREMWNNSDNIWKKDALAAAEILQTYINKKA